MMNKNCYNQFFTYEELACKQTGQIIFTKGFTNKLVELRTKFNKPMPITSACRSREYNHKVGGAPNSFHIYDHSRYGFTGCCAIDVAIKDPTEKGDLIAFAWSLGWSIGIHKNFIHLDRRTDYTKLKQIIFFY